MACPLVGTGLACNCTGACFVGADLIAQVAEAVREGEAEHQSGRAQTLDEIEIGIGLSDCYGDGTWIH